VFSTSLSPATPGAEREPIGDLRGRWPLVEAQPVLDARGRRAMQHRRARGVTATIDEIAVRHQGRDVAPALERDCNGRARRDVLEPNRAVRAGGQQNARRERRRRELGS
jgi:hypothetical protein